MYKLIITMLFIYFYYIIFPDLILELLNDIQPLVDRIKFKIKLIKKDISFRKEKEEKKKYYENKKNEIKKNSEKNINEIISKKNEKIKQIEEKYDKLYKELDCIKDQEQFIKFFNKYKNI